MITWFLFMSVLKTGVDFRGESRKWQWSEIRVRIWRTGWHTPIKKSEEVLLGHQYQFPFVYLIILRRKVFNWSWDVYMKWFVKCNIHRTARSIRFMYFERAFKKRGETKHGHSSEIQTTEKWVKLRSGSYLKQSSSRLWI